VPTEQTVLDAEELKVITEQVWTSYLDADGGRPLKIGPAPSTPTGMSGAVSITGDWNGHVVVECSMAAARLATSAMVGTDVSEVSDEDVSDVLGELANVIGGGVKGLLASACALSLPHVVTSPGARRAWPAVAEVCRLEASWLDEPVVVSVLESRQELAEQAAHRPS
jgi:chemotaxis protein CheX